MLREKSHCEFALAVSHETAVLACWIKSQITLTRRALISSITSIAHEESGGYKVESQNDPTTSDLKPYLSQFGSCHHRARDNQIHENQSIRGDYRMKSDQIYLQVALVESDYKHNPHARFLTTVWLQLKHRYDTNYAVSLASVMWLQETLVVRE